MTKLTVLVGPPGCGKSTYAKRFLLKNGVVLSSDGIRKELYGDEREQGHNAEVFSALYNRMNEKLAQGINVTVDATNINIATRKKLFDNLKVHGVFVRAIVIDTSYENCIKNNSLRARRVPDDIIKMYFSEYEEPSHSEGFNEIKHIKIKFIRPHKSSDVDII